MSPNRPLYAVRRAGATLAPYRTRLAILAALAVFPLALFLPVTLGGRTLVPYDALVADPLFTEQLAERGIDRPHNALVADLVYQNLVWKQYIASAVHRGEAPLWNRYLAGGMPFLAAGQSSALYPTILLFLAMPTQRAFGYNALVMLWLAAAGMFWLGRTLGLGRFASTAIGVAWSSSTLFVANTVFPMIQGVMAWTPIVLVGVELAAKAAASRPDGSLLPRGRGALAILVLATATAMAALSGHIELFTYAALTALFYGSFRVLGTHRRAGLRVSIRLAFWLSLGAVGGVLLAGLQLVPMAELMVNNWRHGQAAYETAAGYAFGLRQIVTFLVPDFYGNPAHHAVWDILRGAQVPLSGDAMWGTAWGTKNYVEAAAYVGVLVSTLAGLALIVGRRRGVTWCFACLALLSLSFAFGLPTYRLLYYGLPGIDQLHTPFRWVFPFALSVVVLAGFGLDHLVRQRSPSRAAAVVGAAAVIGGLGVALLLATAFGLPRAWVALADVWLDRLPAAKDAVLASFPDVSSFASYEFWNLLHLAVFLLLGGVAVLVLNRCARRPRSLRIGQLVAIAAIGGDLFLVGFGFNPAVDDRLADVRPAAAEWLAEASSVKWGRVVGYGTANVLWPNTAMRFGVPDIRAYDSVIPHWIADALDSVAPQLPPNGMLRYNRLGNLQTTDELRHPLVSALGGRYIVSTESLDENWLDLVYQDRALRIYENTRALPRAWLVNHAEVIPDRQELLARLADIDPLATVLLEQRPETLTWRELAPGRQIYRPAIQFRPDTEGLNSLELEVYGATPGDMLVLSEAWFPGWRAWVTTSGPEGSVEVEVPIYRADGMLRAIPVPQGLSTVHFRYFPLSTKVGLYATFLGLIALLLTVAFALWDRWVRIGEDDTVGRIAVNSAGPMAAALLNKIVDFAFAMLMLRVLGPENAGKYYTAIVIIGFAEIFTNFGLNLLTARDVARRPQDGPRYLTHTSVLRLVLWAASLPMLGAYVAVRASLGKPLASDTVLAVALLALALVPGNLNSALSSLFQARERMVLPAGVSIIATLAKVSLGALVLLAGYGFVGLASVAIFVNWLSFVILAALAAQAGMVASASLSVGLMGSMAIVSLPLMLNHLLQTVFFKIDVLLLDQIQGATVVGWYSSAYKWIDALLIIPAYFTMALFPLLSRRAETDPSGMHRAYDAGLRWLISIALPISLTTTVLAQDLIRILAGAEYLPHGATALQIMVWFLPFSFVNGLTQYVLIAADRQRWITVSFAVAALFNIGANWLLIPTYSYTGAAVVTIASEIVLMVPFRWRLRDFDATPLIVLAWRPALATSLSALALVVLQAVGAPPAAAAAVGIVVYAGALYALGGVTADDRRLMARLIPARPRRPTAYVDRAGGQ